MWRMGFPGFGVTGDHATKPRVCWASDEMPERGRPSERDGVLRIGTITVGALDEWTLNAGTVTSWHPTPAAAEKPGRHL